MKSGKKTTVLMILMTIFALPIFSASIFNAFERYNSGNLDFVIELDIKKAGF